MGMTGPLAVPPLINRRCGYDRRILEKAFEGKHDRRRGIESRRPEVSVLEMSTSDWIALVETHSPSTT